MKSSAAIRPAGVVDGFDADATEIGAAPEAAAGAQADAPAGAVETLCRQIFELVPDAIVIHCGGIFVYANGTALRMYGATDADEIVGLNLFDLVHPDSHEAFQPYIDAGEAVAAPDEPVSAVGMRMDGRYFDSESTLVAITWNGKPAVLSVIRDVSARLEAESLLRESEERFSLAVEGSNDGIWDWNLETNVAYHSPRLKNILGYAPEDIPDYAGSLDALIHPEDVAHNNRRIEDHFEGRTDFYEVECRMRHKSGEYRWIYVRGKAIRDEAGDPRRIAGTFSDITDRKHVEEERTKAEARAHRAYQVLEDALDVASEGFALFDWQDRLVLFNEKYKQSCHPITHLIAEGITFSEILQAMIESGAGLDGGLEPGAFYAKRMAQHRDPKGPYVTELAGGQWLQIMERRTADGGTVLVRSDITPVKRVERALKARVEELERTKRKLEEQGDQLARFADELQHAKETADAANRTKSEFLANMSHELRTPLNAIIGFSEVLKNQMFGPVGVPQYAEYATDIYNSGAHLLDIINDILDISKVEAGKFELVEERIEIPRIAAAVMRLIKGRAEEGGVLLRQSLPGSLPRLYADTRALKQMLLNLLSNAVKFTPRGGRVELSAVLDDDGAVRLAVSDNGVGIDPSDFAKVLSPFGQVDSTLSREYEGTGLGLPLVKALAELHGGRLELESALGEGTTVTLMFPASRSIATPPPGAAARR